MISKYANVGPLPQLIEKVLCCKLTNQNRGLFKDTDRDNTRNTNICYHTLCNVYEAPII